MGGIYVINNKKCDKFHTTPLSFPCDRYNEFLLLIEVVIILQSIMMNITMDYGNVIPEHTIYAIFSGCIVVTSKLKRLFDCFKIKII